MNDGMKCAKCGRIIAKKDFRVSFLIGTGENSLVVGLCLPCLGKMAEGTPIAGMMEKLKGLVGFLNLGNS